MCRAKLIRVFAVCVVVLGFLPVADSGVSMAQERAGELSVLRVAVGKSLIVNSPEPLKRVSISDPGKATALVLSETQVLINGNAPGNATLTFWDQQDRARSFELQIVLDFVAFRETLDRVLPDQSIEIRQSGASLVLTGKVSSEQVSQQAEALAKTQTPNVVNLLSISEKRDVVLLQVRFAEINRDALQELGLNIFSTGGANTFGATSTQQFGPVSGNVGALPSSVRQGGQQAQTSSAATGSIGSSNQDQPATFGLSDLLNLFIFRPDINLGVTLRALEQRNLLQILAEPNVLALDGKEASFLAGGEFPFPVVQGGTNFTAVTIQFREFGVRLKFTPTILDDGKIRLKVNPEVSALDFANALTISGFLVPAISTRKAETEVELSNGQSFAIAGLIDNRLVEIASKIPLLGDIPFFGKLFRSRSLSHSKTELMVMVTPRLVRALEEGQEPQLPEFPKPFPEDPLKPKSGEERQPEGKVGGKN